jgi:magnesium-transporting ATPase (P-type)
VGTGVGAKFGVLIKGGAPLEAGHKVDTIVFDKTGTLTHGKPWVTDVEIMDEQVTEREFWRLVGSAEMGSEHPLARAVVEYAATSMQLQLAHPAEFQARVGKGVTCTVDHREVCLGTRELMQEVGAVVRAEEDARIRSLEALGKTVLLVSLAPHTSLSGAPTPSSVQGGSRAGGHVSTRSAASCHKGSSTYLRCIRTRGCPSGGGFICAQKHQRCVSTAVGYAWLLSS